MGRLLLWYISFSSFSSLFFSSYFSLSLIYLKILFLHYPLLHSFTVLSFTTPSLSSPSLLLHCFSFTVISFTPPSLSFPSLSSPSLSSPSLLLHCPLLHSFTVLSFTPPNLIINFSHQLSFFLLLQVTTKTTSDSPVPRPYDLSMTGPAALSRTTTTTAAITIDTTTTTTTTTCTTTPLSPARSTSPIVPDEGRSCPSPAISPVSPQHIPLPSPVIGGAGRSGEGVRSTGIPVAASPRSPPPPSTGKFCDTVSPLNPSSSPQAVPEAVR